LLALMMPSLQQNEMCLSWSKWYSDDVHTQPVGNVRTKCKNPKSITQEQRWRNRHSLFRHSGLNIDLPYDQPVTITWAFFGEKTWTQNCSSWVFGSQVGYARRSSYTDILVGSTHYYKFDFLWIHSHWTR
jgi:hypothetical protein